MYNVYTRLAVPDVPREVLEPGLVCVTNWSQQWYRVQVRKKCSVIIKYRTGLNVFIGINNATKIITRELP